MKKWIEKINKMSPFMVGGILIVVGIIILFFLKKCSESDAPLITNLTGKVEEYKDHLGQTRAKIENTGTNGNNGLNAALAAENKKLASELGIKESQILAVTELNGTLRDSLKLVALERDAANNKIWKWQNEKPSGSKYTAEMSEKDSVLHLTNIDIKTKTTDFTEGKGKKKKYYTDFFTPDENITFNGAKTYRIENKEIKDILQVDFNTMFQKGFINKDWDGISGELELMFNPDGNFKVGFGAGATYLFQQSKFYPYGQIKTSYNLFRVR